MRAPLTTFSTASRAASFTSFRSALRSVAYLKNSAPLLYGHGSDRSGVSIRRRPQLFPLKVGNTQRKPVWLSPLSNLAASILSRAETRRSLADVLKEPPRTTRSLPAAGAVVE